MTPYITLLPFLVLLASGIDGSVWLNKNPIHSKNPGETDLNAIKVQNPNKINNLTIKHSAILNVNYQPLKKFHNLTSFYLTDVTGAPRITKDFFRNFPELTIFALLAKNSYNEVEFEEDALSYANKLKHFVAERLYTISRLSSRFLGPNTTNLETLALDKSAVSVVEANAFDFANNLTYLSISGEGSIKIEKGAFKKLTKLQHFYLDMNIQDFSWNMFGLLPLVTFSSFSNLDPDEINVDEIKKYFPKLKFLMVFVDNCKPYERISKYSNGFFIMFMQPHHTKPCFRLYQV